MTDPRRNRHGSARALAESSASRPTPRRRTLRRAPRIGARGQEGDGRAHAREADEGAGGCREATRIARWPRSSRGAGANDAGSSARPSLVPQLLARMPRHVKARTTWRSSSSKRGDLDGALQELDARLEQETDNVSVLCNRAAMHSGACATSWPKRISGARSAAMRQRRSADESRQSSSASADAGARRSSPCASLRGGTQSGPAHYYLGEAYNHIDQLPAAARRAYEAAASLQPSNWRAYKGVGIVLDRMGRPTEAAIAYQRAARGPSAVIRISRRAASRSSCCAVVAGLGACCAGILFALTATARGCRASRRAGRRFLRRAAGARQIRLRVIDHRHDDEQRDLGRDYLVADLPVGGKLATARPRARRSISARVAPPRFPRFGWMRRVVGHGGGPDARRQRFSPSRSPAAASRDTQQCGPPGLCFSRLSCLSPWRSPSAPRWGVS